MSRTCRSEHWDSRLQGAPRRPPEGCHFEGKRATAMTIETKVSERALRQSQRRGISRETLDLVLSYHDRTRKLPGYARALWIWGGELTTHDQRHLTQDAVLLAQIAMANRLI